MLSMGLQDVWRKVYPDLEDLDGVGPKREHRRIDRILISPRVSELVQAAHTPQVGGSDHLTVVAKICPTLQFKPRNVWRFPSAVLQSEELLQGMRDVFSEKRGLAGEVWWESVLHNAQILAT